MTYSIFHTTRTLQLFLEFFVFAALVTGWLRPAWGRELFSAAERHFLRFAAVRWQAILLAGLFPLVVRVLLLPVFPIPQPRVHDEFSHLLLGDTLAHGRVANPVPPLWEHFETEYELVQPTYASQYQPGQGFFLAAGQLLTGRAWWGVWFSTGLMCAALCWALGSVLPPGWALFGSLVAALQFGIFGFWMNSYFGGAVPAIGGALVFGALTRRTGIFTSMLCGAGIVLMLASRPVEGAIWLAVAAVMMLRSKASPRSILAAGAVLVMGAIGLGLYNGQITGSLFEFPYALYRQHYGTPQSYWWQPPVLISHFNHAQLAANYENQLDFWQRRYSVSALGDSIWHRVRDFWRFFLGPALTPAFVLAFFYVRRRLRAWLVVSAIFILEHATYHAWYPQQSASETVLIVLLIVEGWRRLRLWRRFDGRGLAMSRHLSAAFAFSFALICVGLVFPVNVRSTWGSAGRIWETMTTRPNQRATAIRRLEAAPGKHLVFVKYGPNHPWYDEWVFNGADLTGSRIVFARMCNPESDLALARAMSDRDVWIASPEEGPLIARITRQELLLAELR